MTTSTERDHVHSHGPLLPVAAAVAPVPAVVVHGLVPLRLAPLVLVLVIHRVPRVLPRRRPRIAVRLSPLLLVLVLLGAGPPAKEGPEVQLAPLPVGRVAKGRPGKEVPELEGGERGREGRGVRRGGEEAGGRGGRGPAPGEGTEVGLVRVAVRVRGVRLRGEDRCPEGGQRE